MNIKNKFTIKLSLIISFSLMVYGFSNNFVYSQVDITPPTISSVTITEITPFAATVKWTINEPSNSQIAFCKTYLPGCTNTTPLVTDLTLQHTINLSGLSPNTTYYMWIKSKDTAGNLRTYYRTFRTANGTPMPTPTPGTTSTPTPGTDRTPPTISSVTITELTPFAATIKWNTNEPANGQIAFCTTYLPSCTNSTPIVPDLTIQHTINLSGLTPNTTYYMWVKSKDASGNLRTYYRSFRTMAGITTPAPIMGFTPWPYDLTDQAVAQTYAFLEAHADIYAHHFDGGVPWPEAYSGDIFPKQLQDDWDFRKRKTPAGVPIYLAITPVSFSRDGLAAYWGADGDTKPIPEPWNTYRLNDEHIKQAFLNYSKRAIEYFKPKYLAIGIETNIIISVKPEIWNDYKELNQYIYAELKKIYPNLPIFSTVQYEHLRGLADESKANLIYQAPGVADLMKSSDLLALSTYRFGKDHNPVSADYFKPALIFGKKIAISETGAISKDVTIWGVQIKSDEALQKEFVNFILSEGQKNKFAFIINWVAIDFDLMLPKLPPEAAEIGKAWVYTGLQESSGRAKPALTTWDNYRYLWSGSGEAVGL